MAFVKIAATIVALGMTASAHAMTTPPKSDSAAGLPATGGGASSGTPATVDVPAPPALLLLGMAAAGLIIGRRARK